MARRIFTTIIELFLFSECSGLERVRNRVFAKNSVSTVFSLRPPPHYLGTTLIYPVLFSLMANIASSQMMPGMMGGGHPFDSEKSPGIAALLSLQPMPLALGNFYADDWEKGILYTTVEVGLAIPGIILLSDRYGDHFHDGGAQDGWTDTEQVWFISLVTGYVLTKVLSAYDAASSVERQLRREQRVSLHMTGHTQGVLVKASITF